MGGARHASKRASSRVTSALAGRPARHAAKSRSAGAASSARSRAISAQAALAASGWPAGALPRSASGTSSSGSSIPRKRSNQAPPSAWRERTGRLHSTRHDAVVLMTSAGRSSPNGMKKVALSAPRRIRMTWESAT